MAQILFCSISNQSSETPLVEVALANGNFNLIALKLIQKCREERVSVDYSEYIFHILRSNGLVYICMADKLYPLDAAQSFLDRLNSNFLAQYGTTAQTAIALSANSEFSPVLDKLMKDFNANPPRNSLSTNASAIKLAADKVLERGEKIDLLVNKFHRMSIAADIIRDNVTNI